jgi:hypothetical protein
MAPKRKLKILKVPLGYKQIYKPINFGPMPQLYLDLLENKTKVKAEYKDQLYLPRWDDDTTHQLKVSNEEVFVAGQDFKNSLIEFDTDGNQLSGLTFASPPQTLNARINKVGFSKPYSEASSIEGSPHHTPSKFVSEVPPVRNKPTLGAMQVVATSTNTVKRKFTRVGDDDDLTDDPLPLSSHPILQPPEPSPHLEQQEEVEEENELSKFLAADLGQPKPHTQSVYGIPVQQPTTEKRPEYQKPNRPLGLDDITLGVKQPGVMNIPATNNRADDDKNARRTELLNKFKKLKKLYKEASIPEFTEYTDLTIMEREYSQICKDLHIESSVDNYKRYLTMGFGVVEFIVKKFLNFEEISGFAAEQMIKMNQYDQILYELGEKHQPDPSKKGLPPEVKLLGIILFNAVVFVGMKMLMKGPGNAVFNNIILPNLGGAGPASSAPLNRPAPKNHPAPGHKTMKGPDINFDDF